MAQILDPLPNDKGKTVLCCYVNATSNIQIARITNVPGWYFERVVFSGQRLVFEAVPEALLEIHSGMMASAILSDTIPCDRLCIQEEGEGEQPSHESHSGSSPTTDKKQNLETGDNKSKGNTILFKKTTLVSAC
jgi:hypothetical protein